MENVTEINQRTSKSIFRGSIRGHQTVRKNQSNRKAKVANVTVIHKKNDVITCKKGKRGNDFKKDILHS